MNKSSSIYTKLTTKRAMKLCSIAKIEFKKMITKGIQSIIKKTCKHNIMLKAIKKKYKYNGKQFIKSDTLN